MSKFPSFFILMLFLFYIIPLSISVEETNNSTNNTTDNLNNTNATQDQDFFFNPYKNVDFGNVIWLDDTNATSEIKKYDLLYIMFYSPWCHPCRVFFPEYVAASRYAEENNLKVKFAKIDVSKSHNISLQYDIQGFPSIFLLIKDKRYFFEGERNRNGLFSFMERKLNDDVYKIEKLSQIKKYTDNNATDLVLLSTLKNTDSVLYKSFLNYSKTIMYIDFISCSTDECIKEYKEDIILFKKYDEKINKYSVDMGSIDKAEIDSVKKFIGIYGVEAGGPLNGIQINMMFEHKRKMLFYFRNSSIKEQTEFDSVMKELGLESRSEKKLYTAIADIQGNPLQEKIAQTFIIVAGDLPSFLFYDIEGPESEKVSIYSIRKATKDQLKKDYIKNYINDISKGKIKNDLFSEAPLDNYIINGLKYVIGRTFDKDVIEEKNNVFLTLIDGSSYSPGTERVLDIMRNLTKRYPTEENKIIFAYSDAGKNQPRDIDISKESPPLVLLYTNAMSEKKVIKMNHQNYTLITEEEVEDFLVEKIKLVKKPKVETEAKVEEKKEEKKEDKKEDKKQTDL